MCILAFINTINRAVSDRNEGFGFDFQVRSSPCFGASILKMDTKVDSVVYVKRRDYSWV